MKMYNNIIILIMMYIYLTVYVLHEMYQMKKVLDRSGYIVPT